LTKGIRLINVVLPSDRSAGIDNNVYIWQTRINAEPHTLNIQETRINAEPHTLNIQETRMNAELHTL
jgi:hypothetical protein